MKHNVTQIEGKNEPVNFSHSVLGNYLIELEPGDYQVEESSDESNTQYKLLQFLWTDKIDYNIVNLVSNLKSSADNVDLEDKFWLLYFDGSKTQEGSRAGFILEFECTNNTTEYEALI